MEETKKAKKKIQVFPIVNAIIMILLGDGAEIEQR